MATEAGPSSSSQTSDDGKQFAINGDVGIRAIKCKSAINKTYKACIGSVRKVLEKECLVFMSDQKHTIIELTKEFQQEVTKAAEEEMELLFEQEGIANFLDKLDALYLEQNKKYGKETAWRPSKSAEDNMAAHLYPVLSKHKADLNELLKQKNDEIELLLNKINKGRSQIEGLVEDISKINNTVKQDSICSVVPSI